MAMTSVAITSGSLSVIGLQGGPVFVLVGNGLSVRGGRDPGNVSAWSCLECGAGTQVSLESLFAGESSLGQGPAVIEGILHSKLFYAGRLHFTGSATISREDAVSVSAAMNVTASFEFEGELKGFLKDPAAGDPGEPVFSRLVKGTGTATLQLAGFSVNGKDRRYAFRSLTYTFK